MATEGTRRAASDGRADDITVLTPIKYILSRPFVYCFCSILSAVGIIFYVKSSTSDHTTFQPFPGSSFIMLNSFLSIIYCVYISLCRLFFSTQPTFSQLVIIGEKLWPFFSLKLIMFGQNIKRDDFDLVWLMW